MGSKFLTAGWRKLAMANYAVDASLLAPFVPAATELDTWNNRCFVSLVGFMFLDVRLKGIPVPFHRNFEEVNLRFYVRHKSAAGEWRRGVVFIKEIVPKPAISFVAKTVYKEKYETMPMDHRWLTGENELEVEYRWKKKSWHTFSVKAENRLQDILPGSMEEFITEHYWGYTKTGEKNTSEYPVEHPRWQVYPVNSFRIDVDFREIYGDAFHILNAGQPASVLLAEGSEIVVRSGNKIT
ncbi:MAG: hypothetical protein FD123_3427 [Bacteroidetes bacterium]|nr:MAG: hypothetical protein FD123_3427 [Bacteroidota bacterium]